MTILSPDPASLRTLAADVAREAGALLLDYASRGLTVETKTSATDPVSEADRASEDLIVQRLLAARPDDGILGEEDAGDRPGTSGVRWVVDPLDGTVNYLYGIPHWSVSIAAEHDGVAIAGAVYAAPTDELFTAAVGEGAWLARGDAAPRRLTVTPVADPGQALVATGFAYDPAARADWGTDAADLLTLVRDLRRMGVASLDLAAVAAGRVDAYVEFALQPWDWAAGRLLVTEAGGTVTDHLRQLGGADRSGLLAAGPGVHGALATWLAGAR